MHLPVKNESKLAVEIPPEVAEHFQLAANMEGIIPRLPQIKIIHRGQLFEMPDESKIETFEGVIIDQHQANAWWQKDISESGGNAMPDCFSLDGITPDLTQELVQSEKCIGCSQNEFGSSGKGKACKNMKRLHIIMDGSLLPRRLTVPPTSIRSFEEHMTMLVDSGLPYACVVTVFSLVKKEVDSFEFAEVKFERNRILNTRELISVANFIKQYKDPARQQEIRAEEYVQDETFEPEDLDKDIPY